ncbi:hypothetical protein ABI214_06650 [Prescottella soli]|uniref:Uncharacterized protein n=1 Tax=Prescottella soli TaxID=1543852 RepID=A0ABW9FPL8_9NOCA
MLTFEAFDNYPPRPARTIVAAARIPGGLRAVMAVLGTRLGRRGPAMRGWMSKRPVPKEVMDAWFRPATADRNIRRDLAKYVVSVPRRAELRDIAARSVEFTGPVLKERSGDRHGVGHGRAIAGFGSAAPAVRFPGRNTCLQSWTERDVSPGHGRSDSQIVVQY